MELVEGRMVLLTPCREWLSYLQDGERRYLNGKTITGVIRRAGPKMVEVEVDREIVSDMASKGMAVNSWWRCMSGDLTLVDIDMQERL